MVRVEDWSQLERLRREKEVLNFYVSGHPLEQYLLDVEAFSQVKLGEIADGTEFTAPIRACGIISGIRTKLDRRENQIAFVTIEDFTGNHGDPIYSIEAAADRVRAAAEAARQLPFKFMLCARAENYLNGRPDLGDTIKRLQAYQEAGADVLFAPGLNTSDEVREVCRSIDRPFNIVRGPRKEMLTVDEVGALGVKRISTGGMMHAVAMSAMIEAARDMATSGAFGFSQRMPAAAEIDPLLMAGANKA